MAAGSLAGADRGAGRIPVGTPPAAGLTTARSTPASIEARGWGWRHAGRRAWALRGLDLRIGRGERVLLLGASGAGKSTLLLALAGLLDASRGGEAEGRLTVDGRPPDRSRGESGLVFQDPESQIVMGAVGDEVAFGLENRCVPRDEIWPRVEQALVEVGFPYGPEHPTDRLSGGEKQRLALAGVLVMRPALLLLDEPTANLDEDAAAAFRRQLAEICETSQTTLLLVEHRVQESLSLVDRVVVIAAGAGVVADGEPDAVFRDSGPRLARLGVWVPEGYRGSQAIPGRAHRSPGDAFISATGVAYRYPDAERDAVSAEDLTLAAGEAVALTGSNGSGKSTLAMLLGGLLRPARGSVLGCPALTGAGASEPWRWSAPRLVSLIGSVFQDPEHQFLCGRVDEELEIGPLRAGLSRTEATRRAGELMDRLHLRHLAAANPFTLSGGEQRRLSVATALASEPKVLILDEPTFGLDLRAHAELAALLAAFRDEGGSVSFATHDRALVDALADRTVRLDAGRVA